MRYIDAEKTYNFYMIDEMTDEYYIKSMTIDEALSHCDEVIPTADVRENVRGEWVNNIHDIPICNQCGYMTPYDRAIDDYEYGNYCPNCGADMRGDKT